VIRTGFARFGGVRRRFTKVGSVAVDGGNVTVIDDYAHHPSEISAALSSLRALYPDKKLGVVFQPHLYSRTRDFALEFSHALNQADRLWLLDIYPARELPMLGITSEWLLSKMTQKNKKLISKNDLIPALLNSDATVYVTIGAGDIGELVPSIKKALYEKTF
jgi:UDP-N-acetylmuramate--alanine ligase